MEILYNVANLALSMESYSGLKKKKLLVKAIVEYKELSSINSFWSINNNLCFYLSHPRGESKRAANTQNPFQRCGELFMKYSEPHTPPKEGKEKYD